MVMMSSNKKILYFALVVLTASPVLLACTNPLVEAVIGARSTAAWEKVIPSAMNKVEANHQVTLSWPDVAEATSYNLYWSELPNPTRTTATKIENVTSPYIHAGLDNTKSYYYFLSAISPSGESGASPILKVTIPIHLVAYITSYTKNNTDTAIQAFTIDPSTGEFSAISGSLSTLGNTTQNYPASITVDPLSRFVYMSNGYTKEVYSLIINPDTGALSFPDVGYKTDLTTDRAGKIAIDPTGKFAFVLQEVGAAYLDSISRINAYTISSSDGTLTPVSGSTDRAIGGSQASGLAVAPSGKFIYIVSNNSSTMSCFSIDSSTGALSSPTWGTAGTMAAGPGAYSIAFSSNGNFYVANGGAYGTAYGVGAYTCPNANGMPAANEGATAGQNTRLIAIDPFGRFVYAESLSDANIAAFKVNTNGSLAAISGSPFSISGADSWAQSMTVDPTGNYLYIVAYNNTAPYEGAVFTYRIDQTTGALSLINTNTSIGNQPLAIAVVSLP